MKKIIADKSEGIAEIIDRILSEEDSDITLVISRASALGKSVRNFNLLKREMDGAEKTIVIESVDETILAFAKQARLEASHPLWRSVRGAGGFSDIVPKDQERGDDETDRASRESDDDEDDDEKKSKKNGRGKKTETKPEPIKLKVPSASRGFNNEGAGDDDEDHDDAEAEEAAEEDAVSEAGFNRFFKSTPAHVRAGKGDDDDDDSDKRGTSSKVWWILIGLIVVLGAVVYALTAYFNRADITIVFKQTPWSYQTNIVADKSVSAINASSSVVVIPAQIFTSNKDVTETFPASSVQSVSQKAQGTITIYNDYSASPQELVATTRFLTPSGQIFRLQSNTTVPGAQVVNGQITPSSINAAIVADQPGPSYNEGPIAKLTIPGFANDPGREAGFYGAITSSTSGGFIGQKAVPTAADIASAKASTTALLEAGLSSGFNTTYPNNFKILDGATTYQVTKTIVNTSTDSNGNFTVFGEATLEAIGFDEGALKAYLLTLAQSQMSNSVFASVNLDYSSVQANFTTGQVQFALTAQTELEPAFSSSDFVNSILGTSIANARTTILGLPDLADGKISVWPLWLSRIPSDPAKVHVVAQ